MPFLHFLCIRIEIVLPSSDLLPYISPLASQSSVNISLALHARDIHVST